MSSPNPSSRGVAIQQVFCSVEQEKLEALVMLLNELIPLVPIPTVEHFERIIIIPDDQRVTVVNDLIKKYDEFAGTYSSDIHMRACAVPLEVSTDDGRALICLIFLSESLVQEINPKKYHSADLTSTLIEELCHIRHYSITWQQRGYFHPRDISPSCKKDLFSLGSSFQAEYVAIRWKASLMASNPLVEMDGGNRTIVYLHYGSLIAPLINEAATDLPNIIRDAADKKLSIGDAWDKLLQIVYRKIFEPLARNEAFQTISPSSEDIPLPSQGVSKNLFFQRRIAPYWKKIKAQLERSFDNDLAEQDIALHTITSILEDFLREMGVTYHKTSSDDCYVLFEYYE